MLKALAPSLTRLCWHSGLLRGFQHLAEETQLRRRADGPPIFPYISKRRAPNFQILTYHRLTVSHDPFFPGLSAEVFAQHVRFLSENYCLVDLGHLVRDLRSGQPIPSNAVALTFDDGYRDNFDLAFPILRQYQAPATIFLTTGFVGGNNALWNDKVSFSLRQTRCRHLSFAYHGEHYYPLVTIEDRLSASEKLRTLLRQVPHADRLAIMGDLFAQLHVDSFQDIGGDALTWDQVRQMKKNRISFGAHTVTHPILSHLPLCDAKREILESKQKIEQELDTPVELFAYPDGGPGTFDDAIINIVREAGFTAAVTTMFGTNTARTNCYSLRRSGLVETELPAFAGKLCWYKFAL